MSTPLSTFNDIQRPVKITTVRFGGNTQLSPKNRLCVQIHTYNSETENGEFIQLNKHDAIQMCVDIIRGMTELN